MNAFDRAVAELYQAPHDSFVAERKRLAGELKAAGHKEEATRLGKLHRPTVSAWAVNQLYWHARDAFDAMLATAEKLRKGNLGAAQEHRDAIAKLRQRAAGMLEDAGHAATEATLRRVTQTLSALAVAGGFDPDPPGALAEDRDPPGFEAIGIGEVSGRLEASGLRPQASGQKAHEAKHTRDQLAKLKADEKEKREAEAEAERRAEQERRRREEEERARIKAERHRLEAALRTAKGELHAKEREVAQLEKQLAKAQSAVADAQAVVDDLQSKLDDAN